MKTYNFDEIIDRSGSGDLKHEALLPRWGRNDLLPLWVADMDFATPDFVVDALKARLSHPIFGYTIEPADYRPTIIDWNESHHGWKIKPEWISFIPGIVKGIGFVVNVFTKPGEKVIIQPPVYHPFRMTPEDNGREVVFNPLRLREDGYYDMDFDNLSEVCDDKCRVLILSNPHNPAGVCWSKETLQRLADFCYEHNIIVISDEIHSDMALFGNRHVPFASVSERAADISITFAAPTKTFNMAGIVSSYAVISNDDLRQRFYGWLKANELDEPTIFAPIATIAAYQKGEEWRKQMLAYVEDNVRFVEDYCREHIPGIRPLRPQASFLVWLNCRGLELSHDKLLDLFIDKAHLALNDGEMFGPGGEGFMRLNVGTPRSVLRQALEQLAKAVNEL
ncbi:MalY/PatB family protein [Prevotella sp. oral taxon 313]|jgi:putative cystathionine beta-lyase patB|uniref:MalY/PatB family protein n=1 Tax=Prevotella sp. oral taxon 313 TaxID=652722 RepID=UPI0018EEA310|nr:PatB family C-S lyase [Prevotella sp. oral taxon 313]